MYLPLTKYKIYFFITIQENYWSKTETYYRPEQLWLLGFLEKEEIGKTLNDLPRYIYSLSSEYRKAIGRRWAIMYELPTHSA